MTSKYADLLARAKEWESNIVNPSEGGKILSELIVALEELETGIAEALKLSGQANYLLARILSVANISAIDGADGFIARYDMPVGPIHKVIPFLAEQGIVVTNDGQILNSPETIVLSQPTTDTNGEKA